MVTSLYIAILTLLVGSCCGTVVENNKTNIGVYVNQISSCNFNHNTLEVLCVNSGVDSLMQYSNVEKLAMCEYNYCLTFRNDPSNVICSGYVWSHRSHVYDPLVTPGAAIVDSSSAQNYSVNQWFLGYNVMVDSFVQNRKSTYEGEVKALFCGEPGEYVSCVSVEDTNGTITSYCGGMVDVTLRDQLSSFLLGITVLFLISGLQYVPLRYAFVSIRENMVVNMLAIPAVSLSIAVILVTVTQSMLVKSTVFILGAFIGIMIGYMTSELLINLTVCIWGRTQVGSSADPGETANMLKCGEANVGARFVITGEDEDDLEDVSLSDNEDDDGTTTIELSEVRDSDDQEEIHGRRI